MKKTILFLYLTLLATLAAATLVEYAQGTAFVTKHIYHSPAFCIGWGLLVIGTLWVVCHKKMWKRLPSLGLHLSFVVILMGAMLTFLTGRKGMLHLCPGVSVTQFVEQGTGHVLDLPFALRLDTFFIRYYPGTEAPSDYVSRVSVLPVQRTDSLSAEISMNRVLDCQSYRFYQSSYDEDGRGSWLSVNYDPWGTAVTYTGYGILALSMLGLLLARRGEFRRLLSHPLLKRGGVLVLCLAVGTMDVFGQVNPTSTGMTKKLSVLSEQEADSLAKTQIIYHDRVTPFHTMALDVVKKLSGKERFGGLDAVQIVGSWQQWPEEWKYVPIIRIKSAELRRRLGLGESAYIRLVDLLDGERYRLRDLWHPENRSSGKPSPLEKAILETDEKVALILMLQQGTLGTPLPTDGSVKPLSERKVRAELLYNRIPFSKILFMGNLTLGFLAFGWLLRRSLRGGKKGNRMALLLEVLLLFALLFHALGYGLRWYIGGRIPLSNGYETMQFLALCVLIVAFLLRRRFSFMVPFGFLLSGFALLVSYLGQMNPQITPLVPVLASPWLSAHVSCIMVSYALLAFIWLNGWLGWFLPREAGRLMLFSRLLLYPAVGFLGIGIFIGAVWANVSWGRYWAWDPKEVWALITFMVYALPFHAESLPCFRRPKFFHGYMLLAFLTVLMTYFGVNFFLGGMHSYA